MKEFRYVLNEEVAEKEIEGWVSHGRMPGHHAERGTLMEIPRAMFYFRGDPKAGEVELCIAPGNHTCQTYKLTRNQLKRLVMEGTDMFWKWPE